MSAAIQRSSSDVEARWREYLQDAPPSTFPRRTDVSVAPTPGALVRHKMQIPRDISIEASKALIQLAWCLVSVYYSDAEDVVIGLAVVNNSGADDDDNDDDAVKPMPFRFHMQESQTTMSCLESVLHHDLAQAPYTDITLERIAQLGPDTQNATMFDNQLIIFSGPDSEAKIELDRAINVECTLVRSLVAVQAFFDDSLISSTEMQRVLGTFDQLLQQLADPTAANLRLGDLNPISRDDFGQVVRWNQHVPPPLHECMHRMIERMVRKTPSAEAVCAGALGLSLSYSQLNDMADKLAHNLVSKGVKPGHKVPFMFEKSPWAIPVMLAVNKAGGAFVPLDPAHQWRDTQALLDACEAAFVVCSPAHEKRFVENDIDRVVIDPPLFDTLPTTGPVSTNNSAQPTDPGYVIFTSGSTGTPKGVVCSHSAWCTNTTAHGPRELHSDKTRLLQFSAYTFDISITDVFTTLAFGGTVCVPTEHERLNDLVGSINRMRVNHAAITPTVAQFLRPDAVPTLRVLVAGGEAMPQDFLDLWAGKARLINSYGPAECTSRVSSTLKSPGDAAANIGTSMGACLWVARGNDPGRLVPIGAIGELLVEGNTLADGYLNDEMKTRECFIQAPKWLTDAFPERCQRARLYRTGDLVRQEADGSFSFIGRRDTQIKVHGVRLEAGHIEAKIKEKLQQDADLVVDKILIGGGDKPKQGLAAFIALPGLATASPQSQGICLLPADDVRDLVVDLRKTLLAALPSYMVPSHLLVVNAIPLGTTGKVSRRALQAFARALPQETLAQFTGATAANDAAAEKPQGEAEIALSKLWAQILDIPLESISRQDGFFGLGGDSVSCMKLVSEGAAVGLHFSVADVFHHPSLAELGRAALGAVQPAEPEPIRSFELIGGPNSFLLLRDQLRKPYKLAVNRIEDIYPATPVQEGMMAETIANPESYLLQEVLKLSGEVDEERLEHALESLVEAYPIIRTRIVRLKGHGTCQVVMSENEPVVLDADTDLTSFMARDRKSHMGYGHALNRFAIIREPGGNRYLVWTSHHAVNDGHMHQLALSKLDLAYNNGRLDVPIAMQYNRFVKAVTDSDKRADGLKFWENQFAGLNTNHYPPCPDMYEPSIADYVTHTASLPRDPARSRFTPSILLRAAWAFVISQASNSDDVIMGVTQSGRDVSLSGVHECMGPCLATMPVRIRTSTAATSFSQYLANVQQQYVDTIPHQHVGLQHIRKASSECADAVAFRNLLVVQPEATFKSKLFIPDDLRNAGDQLNFGLLLECSLSSAGEVEMRAGFDSSLLSADEVGLMMHRLEHVYRQLSNPENAHLSLSELDMVSPHEVAMMDRFNPNIRPLEQCMHWMIEKRAREQPGALMVDSWDARLTYQQANEYSDRLAGVLVNLCVGPETIVAFAFERSAWAVIAIHAILKAGGVCVALDMAHPRDRHDKILADTQARVIVASSTYAGQVAEMGPRHVVAVDRQVLDQLPPRPAHTEVSVSPSNAAWVVYSSGSTGVPKGSILEHRSLCTTSRTNSEILGVGPSTRAIHFASYSFDVAIEETTIIPMYGGTICIPSDEERLNDLSGAMGRLQANWADLTPTIARMLTPEDVPSLRTLVLGGESLTKDIIDTWTGDGQARIFNTYGPSECSIQCTSSEPLVEVATGANIGRPVNCRLWVVDAANPNILLPIGATGELLVEGPILGRGYLNRPTKTKEVFVRNLAWARTKDTTTPRRFYRTGDLARFNLDGTLDCLGRQDSQIKLHGQRVELGEIEYNVKKQLSVPDAAQVAVEAFSPPSGSKLLAAFIQFSSTPTSGSPGMTLMEMSDPLRGDLLRIKSGSARHMPQYMVPSLFVPLASMPMNTSGKIDRKRLREEAARFDQKQLALYSLSATAQAEATTAQPVLSSPVETLLATLWAETLSIDLERDPIAPTDSFLEFGGDSIAAMQLVSKARAAGLGLSVPKMMRSPRLGDMALAATVLDGAVLAEVPQVVQVQVEIPEVVVRDLSPETASTPTTVVGSEVGRQALPDPKRIPLDYSPFQLIDDGVTSVADIKAMLATNYNLNPSTVVDVYPATPLQEGMMALTSSSGDSYVLRDVYELPADVDVAKFKAAWDAIARKHEILRTRVVFIPGLGSCQTIVDEDINWQHAEDLDTYLANDLGQKMDYGTPLARFAIIDDTKTKTFVWTAHHAVYDGHSMALMFAAVDHAYKNNGHVHPSPPFVNVIQHLKGIDADTSERFWMEQLKDVEAAPFPQAPAGHGCQADNTVLHSTQLVLDRKSGITIATMLRGAWSILVSRLSDSPDVVFGVTQSGRDLELDGIESINGPTITTAPVRITVEGRTPVREFLQRVQTQTIDMIPFSHAGLQNIKKISDATRAACGFQNILVIQPADQEEESALFKNHRTATTANYLGGYGLVVECALGGGMVSFSAHYDSAVMTGPQAERLLQQLDHILNQLQAHAGIRGRIQDVDMFSPADRADLVAWNSNYPKVVNECMHDIVARQAVANPSALAIASRTVSLTYEEVDKLSNHLAHQLRELGVVPDKIVPICIEKSPEGIIAMIAIQKAGGAFVPLNPADPTDRLLDLLGQVSATVVIFSEQTRHLQSALIPSEGGRISPVVLPQTLAEWAPLNTAPVRAGATSSHLAYALFTSGSSGRPKAVMIDHRAVASSTYGHGVAMGFAESPRRTVQFASYTFDACIAEIFTALHFGGCVCVPTERERMDDLATFIRDFACDWAFFTPSFVRLLKPEDVPCLKTVVLGGEALNQGCVDVWGDKVHLMNGYGPTETCVFAATRTVGGLQGAHADGGERHRPETIGHPVSSIGWVVDPNDHNRLTPVGCVGELLLQGPSVARGYLGNPEKTAESFIRSPKWLRAFGHGNTSQRLYKTGDLVRQDVSDGTLTYLGRKDNQTKVNGQRLELGEIETQLKAKGTDVESAVVLATKSSSAKAKQGLAAFIQLSSHGSPAASPWSGLMADVDDRMLIRLQDLETAMRATLPEYMIPSLWIPVMEIPIMPASGKTDRKALASLLAKLDTTQVAMYSLCSAEEQDSQAKQATVTDLETTLAGLTARTLGRDPTEVGRNDSFFRLGGDSIAAIQLVAAARAVGITLSTEVIFRQPRICDMATNAEMTNGRRLVPAVAAAIAPFSLVPRGNCHELLSTVEREYGVEKSFVADLLPCAPLQDGLIALTITDPEAYVLREVYHLPSSIDVNRFKLAWEAVVKEADILRTRIVQLGNRGSFQVVMQEDILWRAAVKVEEYIDYDKTQPFGYGVPLVRFALVETADSENYFIWTMHHAIYDGWSKGLMMQHVQEAYRATSTLDKIQPFNRFIAYLRATNPADEQAFWRAQFADLEAQSFPRLPSGQSNAVLDKTLAIDIPLVRKEASPWTSGTILKAAWAIVLGRYTGAPDALFGVVQTGRNVPIEGITDVVGPTIATVPLRIRLDGSMAVSAYLRAVQDQATDMIPFEHTGLQNIARMGSECREACDFTNIMVIQPGGQGDSGLDWLGAQRVENQDKGFLRFAMGLECTLSTSSVLLTGGYDQRLLSEAQMRRLLRQLHAAIQDLNQEREGALVGDVNLISAEDESEMTEMNRAVPEDIRECTHDVIHRVALERGDATAVNAWDVDFRYFELDHLSTKLAHYLASLGVGPETIVPLCFEKSGWAVVAMLGVMKAGAAFVFLDPDYPTARLNDIVGQVDAKVILASLDQAPLWGCISVPVLVVDNVSLELFRSVGYETLNTSVTPSNALYVIFTSGSTGNPKGCVIEHHSFLTCARAQAARSHMTSGSRILQGASYSFDVSVMEMLTALTVGACICVPNERIKKRSVVEVLNDFGATWAFLTPSLVKTIKPADVPRLETLILGGEALTRQNIKTWAGRVRLLNGYGPSECTIAASAHTITSEDEDPANIGKALGGICWITDPDDHNKLAPLGTIGELIIEGNIVARGYLNRPEKTAEVFFENPKWAKPTDGSQKVRRMYKTGDLAYFDTNGDIMFVGRKDAQVKVRGQRMELGEIETHLTRNKKIQHAVVLYPKMGPCKRQLVGVVSLERFGATTNSNGEVVLTDLKGSVLEEVAHMAKELGGLVPRYMVPEVWIAVQSFPLLLSGKLNRKRVEQWLASMDKETHQRICGMAKSIRIQPPSTHVGRQIHRVWAEVLKIPGEEIGITQDFSTLGGDSILGMLAVAKLRAEGYRITMADMASARTIAQLAARIAWSGGDKDIDIARVVQAQEMTDIRFDLTPIQQFYANFTLKSDYLSKQTNMRFNHTFCLSIKKPTLSAESMQGALEALISRHGMLRARFQQEATAACGWRQYISTDTARSYRFRSWNDVSVEQIKPVLEQARQGLDIENGPVMAVDLVTANNNEQYLMMVAHHLVVDLVSWNVILGDLEDYLQTQKFTSEKPYPFSAWATQQQQYAVDNFPPEKALPLPIRPPNYSYWDMTHRINIVRDTVHHTISLSERDTATLLTTCNKSFGAEPMDMLSSALSHSFSYVFRDRKPPTIFRYSHGREAIGSAADVSGTVGWFTTLSPIHVPVRGRDDSISVLRRAIASRKKLPMNGLAYFASRYYHPAGMKTFPVLDQMEVTINYLGNADNQRRSASEIFDMSGAIQNGLGAEGQEVKAFALFSISAEVVKGKLEIQCVWNGKMARQEEIRKWFFEFGNALKDVAYQARKGTKLGIGAY